LNHVANLHFDLFLHRVRNTHVVGHGLRLGLAFHVANRVLAGTCFRLAHGVLHLAALLLTNHVADLVFASAGFLTGLANVYLAGPLFLTRLADRVGAGHFFGHGLVGRARNFLGLLFRNPNAAANRVLAAIVAATAAHFLGLGFPVTAANLYRLHRGLRNA